MDVMTDFVPIFNGVVEKALRETGKTDDEINDLKGKMKNILQNDGGVVTKINDLVKENGKIIPAPAKEEAKTIPAEDGEPLPLLRAFVRPAITLSLTGAFIFLIVFPVVVPNANINLWEKTFTPFMAVFNLLLGFWFGERSALKVPGGEKEPPKKPGVKVVEPKAQG